MIGYHYTSWQNWKRIRKEGLKPYLMQRSVAQSFYRDRIYAIYVWKRRLRGIDAVGSIIYTAGVRGCRKVVLLRAHYTRDDTKEPVSGSTMDMTHTGSVGNLKFHNHNVEARLLFNTIPPEKVDLVETYNIIDLLKYARRK